ncbi:ATP-binding protein [Amycolatopsis magusensis]|uniref:ATP-binding protein n=1 Tax=Amycolatopsis magusensis TaxID=882444 RepID=UPI003C2E5733
MSSPAGEPTLGALLRGWRDRALLTQEQLAARTGLNVRSVRRLEAGELARPRSASVRALADALGLDDTERASLTRAVSGTSPDRRTGTVPRQLPAPVSTFVGRARELALLTEPSPEGAMVVTAIDGMAGVGKTSLAVHAAHRLSSCFPDGSLFADLRGHAHGTAAVDPADLLARLLEVLGVDGDSIPAHLDDRSALYRSLLADRRMLVVLDNAADEAQVWPLLPGPGGCRVFVTSRRRLVGLDRASTVSVGVMPTPDAIALFTAAAGRERVEDASPESLAELAGHCGALPLALSLAAARLRAHPSWTVPHLLRRLDAGHRTLTELRGGQQSVLSALELSYEDLNAAQSRAYRLLGLHPGAHVTPEAATALLGTSVPAASAMLDELLEVHLLEEPVPGQFAFHDLIRVHAAEAAEREEGESVRRAALNRLLEHYGRTASAVMDHLYPYEADMRPRLPHATTETPEDPVEWLDAELPNLLPLARTAAEHDFAAHTRHLAGTLHRCLRTRGRYSEAEGLHERALSTARSADDRLGEVEALLGLGELDSLRGHHEAAAEKTARAFSLARAIDHRPGELRALIGLGFVKLELMELKEAADHYEEALDLARALGHRTGELDALVGASHVERVLGNDDQAIEYLTSALDLARATGHHTSEARALNGLGYVHLKRDEPGPATERFTRALELARDTGYRVGELSSLAALGDLHHLAGRYQQAHECFQDIAELAGQIGNRNWQFEAVHSLGRLQYDAGNFPEALDHHAQALALATDLDQPSDQARAHDGLACAHHALTRNEQARHHWTRALDILTELGVEETDERGVNVRSLRARVVG